MLRLTGQVVGVVDKVSQKGTAYKVVKVLEMGQNTRITFVQDFRGIPVQVGEELDIEVSGRAYLNKAGSAEMAWTAWAAKDGQQQAEPLKAVGGGKYR